MIAGARKAFKCHVCQWHASIKYTILDVASAQLEFPEMYEKRAVTHVLKLHNLFVFENACGIAAWPALLRGIRQPRHFEVRPTMAEDNIWGLGTSASVAAWLT